MSAPQSTIYICSGVRLDNRYDHTIYFDSETAQRNYFAGKVVKTFSAYSYLRKTWPLQVQATMEEARKWSYLYFRNGTGKYYYYFITQVEYKNENMVELTLDLDVIQTYLFDFDLLQCYVERQHTETDVAGEHTVEEGLEVGELIDDETNDETAVLGDLCILVLASINPNYSDTGSPIPALSGMYDKVFSGLKVWAVDSAQWADWGKKLDELSEAGFLDGIISMWMYPQLMVNLGGENTWGDEFLCKVVDTSTANTHTLSLAKPPDTVDDYTPKNKKLLTYPYRMLYVTNNSGQSAVYRFERFASFKPTFRYFGSASPEGVVRMAPVGYNGVPHDTTDISGVNYEQGLTLGNFPTCAWDADVYKMWLAQNQNQHNLNTATATVKAVGGAVATAASALTGNLMGAGAGVMAMASGAQSIAGQLAQKADMAIQPPQARGAFSTNVNVGAGKQTFTYIRKCITAEQAKVLDGYFTMYGYRLNEVRQPNLKARPAFTYIKTVGCKIKGDLCTEDIVRIENIFDRGVTFWVNGDRIADYSQNNAV